MEADVHLIYSLLLTRNRFFISSVVQHFTQYNFQMSHNVRMQNDKILHLLQEYRDLANMNFRFKEKQRPRLYVSSRASKLCDYPMNEVLCADQLYPQWKPELIDTIVKCLTPQNIRVHLAAKAYESVANETERWYDTKYKKERIPAEIIDMWENAGYNSEFHLPAKNEFIPSRLNIKPRDDNVIGYYFIYVHTCTTHTHARVYI